MPNNPAARRAGATPVSAGNKLVRNDKLAGVVDAATSSLKASTDASSSAASTPDSSGIPAGLIAMWSGTLVSIPAGWALCDGTNGTPDLRDKFVKGASAGAGGGATGGSLTHQHALSATATVSSVSAGTPAGSIDAHTTASDTATTGAGTRLTGPTSHTFTGSALGSHTHVIGGVTDNVADARPPFYAVCFIIKKAGS